jgi:hypothetical protein
VSVVMSFLVSVSGWVGGVGYLERIITVRLCSNCKVKLEKKRKNVRRILHQNFGGVQNGAPEFSFNY